MENIMSFYAVANGREIGIFTNWNDCNRSIKGYSGCKFKKFGTRKEAEDFILSSETIETDFVPDYYVYTDGACSNNGRKNASAGIGIYFGEKDTRNVSERIEGKQTNNTAELTAIIRVYDLLKEDIEKGKKIMIVSDSEYAIRCVTSYGSKCEKSEWKKAIPNQEMVKYAYELYKNCPNIGFKHIMAHTQKKDIHSIGNEQADRLANESLIS